MLYFLHEKAHGRGYMNFCQFPTASVSYRMESPGKKTIDFITLLYYNIMYNHPERDFLWTKISFLPVNPHFLEKPAL